MLKWKKYFRMSLSLTPQSIQVATLLAAVLATIVPAIFAWRALELRSRQKRAEMFFSWNKWFDSAEGFGSENSILPLLDEDDVALQTIPWQKREALLAFYEEVAIAVNTNLLKIDVATYMFGYYAVKILESKNFWFEDYEKPYWKLFVDFAERAKHAKDTMAADSFNVRKLRF